MLLRLLTEVGGSESIQLVVGRRGQRCPRGVVARGQAETLESGLGGEDVLDHEGGTTVQFFSRERVHAGAVEGMAALRPVAVGLVGHALFPRIQGEAGRWQVRGLQGGS